MSLLDTTAPDAGSRAARREERRRSSARLLGTSTAFRVMVALVLVVLAASWFVPLLWGLLTSLKTEDDAASVPLRVWPSDGFTLEHYVSVLQAGGLPTWLVNSLLSSTLVTVLAVVISALAAYALSRLDFAGRRLLQVLTLAAIMVPAQLLVIPLYSQMQTFGLVDNIWGIVLPQIVVPVNVVILTRFFDMVPRELEEAAYIDGASHLRVFWTIVLPLSRSILVAVAIFTFIGSWNNFLWPFLITNDPAQMTMPVGVGTVQNAYGVNYARSMATAVIAAAPLLIVFMFFQRQIVKGIATTGLGGQ
ncbi:carbohydrate ABC transporter permease [Pseudonocardia sp. HH130630-07]|uniref:carbohydrate ABC transporter permease n=1 Tax=Pseudonocardia sp. HH130630-07 TaxID=1690815 RepID=UPI0008150DBD|nr:carbohydrate ABC transporter permease [Pseudonocardia sp. HH130630-07]ANY09764.1 sugar ABC transporter permease [Pseudonocardia sp. HH130630-07]